VLTVGVLTVAGLVCAIQRGDPRWMFLSLPFTLAVFVMGRYGPVGYRLAVDGVRVERRAGPVTIPYRRIRGVDRQPRPIAGMSIFGSQGVFGRFGRFWNMRLGLYRLFLTNRTTIVWLATDDGWLGLSPDRPDEFVAGLRARLASPR
jgi:PH (Pleckstrin Homology) domain-containing protein